MAENQELPPPYKQGLAPSSILERTVFRFFEITEEINPKGGYWVSRNGGTLNVIAGELTKIFSNVNYFQARAALRKVGGENWYNWLYNINPHLPKGTEFKSVVEEVIHQAHEETTRSIH